MTHTQKISAVLLKGLLHHYGQKYPAAWHTTTVVSSSFGGDYRLKSSIRSPA